MAGRLALGGYRTYAYGEENDLIDVHPYFLEQSFKKDIEECRAWYRQFVAAQLTTSRRDPRMSDGPFLGSEEFVKEQMENGPWKRQRKKSR